MVHAPQHLGSSGAAPAPRPLSASSPAHPASDTTRAREKGSDPLNSMSSGPMSTRAARTCGSGSEASNAAGAVYVRSHCARARSRRVEDPRPHAVRPFASGTWAASALRNAGGMPAFALARVVQAIALHQHWRPRKRQRAHPSVGKSQPPVQRENHSTWRSERARSPRAQFSALQLGALGIAGQREAIGERRRVLEVRRLSPSPSPRRTGSFDSRIGRHPRPEPVAHREVADSKATERLDVPRSRSCGALRPSTHGRAAAKLLRRQRGGNKGKSPAHPTRRPAARGGTERVRDLRAVAPARSASGFGKRRRGRPTGSPGRSPALRSSRAQKDAGGGGGASLYARSVLSMYAPASTVIRKATASRLRPVLRDLRAVAGASRRARTNPESDRPALSADPICRPRRAASPGRARCPRRAVAALQRVRLDQPAAQREEETERLALLEAHAVLGSREAPVHRERVRHPVALDDRGEAARCRRFTRSADQRERSRRPVASAGSPAG